MTAAWLGRSDTGPPAAGILCNRGLIPPPNQPTTLVAAEDMLCHPGALSLDRLGNLYVSDHGPEVEGNWRLLMFVAGLFPANNTAPGTTPGAAPTQPQPQMPPSSAPTGQDMNRSGNPPADNAAPAANPAPNK